MLYALRYMFYHLHSTLFLIFFFNFLKKTGEQHKGKLLVVVSFFVYFRRETSSGNDYY